MFCKQCNTTLHSQTTSNELTVSSMKTYPKDYFSPWLLVWIQFINVISSNCFDVSFMALSEIYYLKNPNIKHDPIFSNYNNAS